MLEVLSCAAICEFEWAAALKRYNTPLSAEVFKRLGWEDCCSGGDFIDYRDNKSYDSVCYTNTHKHYTDAAELVTGEFGNFKIVLVNEQPVRTVGELQEWCKENYVLFQRY